MTLTCDTVRDRLAPYLACALDPAERASIDLHLAGCAECRADRRAAAFLAAPVAGLPREIVPPSDLWTGIAPRLASRPRRLAIPVWQLAAAAVVLAVASSAVTMAMLRQPTGRAEVAVGFASTEARYQQATLEVTDLYQRARDSLAPDTRLVLERNLAVIERALGEARAALRTDPSNRTLEAMVVTAYQRKIEFLERAAALDRTGG